MAIRPSFLEVTIDGRKHRLTGGPQSRTGEMHIELYVRQHGKIRHLLNIDCIPFASGKNTSIVIKDTDEDDPYYYYSQVIEQ